MARGSRPAAGPPDAPRRHSPGGSIRAAALRCPRSRGV